MRPKMKWEDWVGMALGVLLIASPWLAGYSGNQNAVANAVIAGGVIVLAELLGPLGVAKIGEAIGAGAGLWLMASPFVLGFGSQLVAAVVTAGMGLLILLFTAWTMTPAAEEDEN